MPKRANSVRARPRGALVFPLEGSESSARSHVPHSKTKPSRLSTPSMEERAPLAWTHFDSASCHAHARCLGGA